MSERHIRSASVHRLHGLAKLALGDEPGEARKAFLRSIAQETLHAIENADTMTPQMAEQYAAEVVVALKGALMETRLLKKLPNPRFRR